MIDVEFTGYDSRILAEASRIVAEGQQRITDGWDEDTAVEWMRIEFVRISNPENPQEEPAPAAVSLQPETKQPGIATAVFLFLVTAGTVIFVLRAAHVG